MHNKIFHVHITSQLYLCITQEVQRPMLSILKIRLAERAASYSEAYQNNQIVNETYMSY